MDLLSSLISKIKGVAQSMGKKIMDDEGIIQKGKISPDALRSGAETYLKTYQKIQPFIPFAPPVYTPQQIGEGLDFWKKTISKRVVEPAKKIVSPQSTLPERAIGAIQTFGNVAFPMWSVGYAGYEGLKSGIKSVKEGKDFETGFKKGFSGEELVSPSQLVKNKPLGVALDVGEFALPFVMGRLTASKDKTIKAFTENIKKGNLEKAQLIAEKLSDKDPRKVEMFKYLNNVIEREIMSGSPKVKLRTPPPPKFQVGESGGEVAKIKVKGSTKPQVTDDFIKSLEEEQKLIQPQAPGQQKPPPPPKNLSELQQEAYKTQANVEFNKDKLKEGFTEWVRKRFASEAKAIKSVNERLNIPDDINPVELIKKIENPNYKTSDPRLEQASKQIRALYDELYQEAKKSGVNMNYVKNYLTHIWQEPPEVVSQMYKNLSQKFKFSQERVFPTYEEGIKMGLTPKYSNPKQIVAEYIKNLEKTKANLGFFKFLKENNFVTEKRVPGMVPIDAPGFPTKQVRIGKDKFYEGVYYAPIEVKNLIDKVFSPQGENAILKTLGKASTGFQDILLSGGIPKTPVNAWSIAQLTREFLAGRVISPLKSFFTAFSENATNRYIQNSMDDVIAMQKRGIPFSSNVNIENLARNNAPFIEKVFGKNIGEAWNKFVNEPTFKRFMPLLELRLFQDVKNQMLSKGKTLEEAYDIASQAVKNFYGGKTIESEVLANKNFQNFIRTFFFAPKYRQTLINFWLNNIKALKNPLAPENQYNIRFVIGAILTYFGMNEINKANTGRNMWENPPGMEDKMLIKTSDGYIGVPFLSSIATIPRGIIRQAKRLTELDFPGFSKDVLQTYAGSLVKPVFDVFANSDYFGKPIYEENDSKTERAKKIMSYLATQYTGHPYIREILDKRNQEDPAYQRLSRAMELPLRFYSEKTINARYYYQIRDNILKGLTTDEREAFNAIPKINNQYELKDPNNRILKYQIYLTYPEVFKARQAIELQMALKTNKPIDPLYLIDYNIAKVYMRYETLPEASPERKALLKAYPELSVIFEARSKFFEENPIKEEDLSKSKDIKDIGLMDYPKPSEYVKKQMEAKNWSDPQVKDYLNSLRLYQNQQRMLLGLPPVDQYGNIAGLSTGGFSYKKKLKVKKAQIKTKKLSFKLPKLKALTISGRKSKQVKNLQRGRILKVRKISYK